MGSQEAIAELREIHDAYSGDGDEYSHLEFREVWTALQRALEGWEEAEGVIREVWEHCDSIPAPISQYVVGKTFSK